MERDISLSEISDGRKYTHNDCVKADCNDCVGCSECCSGMGESIVLDPYDVLQLKHSLQCRFEQLLEKFIELHVVEGNILPNLKMQGVKEQCGFLNAQGRCSIHSVRPGFCRLFPLGRIYENGGFSYFLLTKECVKKNRTKVKIKNWLGVANIKDYERFICEWHYFLKELTALQEERQDDVLAREMNMKLLKEFYIADYSDGFYEDVHERMEAFRHMFH